MLKKLIYQNYTYIVVISLYSFTINYFYANIGAFPIDTFAFFDTAFNILQDRHPFKDYWITTGPLVDYLQALFFLLFGTNWTSYVIHGSLFNCLISLSLYFSLRNLGFKGNYSFIYSLLFATLIYTISGTPFAYIHSYVFSVLSILIFIFAISRFSKTAFFLLPITMTLSFAAMQNPSTLINILLILATIFFCIKYNKLNLLGFFFIGSVTSLILITSFFLITKIDFSDFYNQYILFPLSIGENRITDSDLAHFGISDRLSLRGVIGHFKFIYIYLLATFLISFYFLKQKIISSKLFIINSIIILSCLLLIFNQLITSNQTYIFSLIPLSASFLHFTILQKYESKYLDLILILITILITLKYHLDYNTERKFHDLQNVNLNNAQPAYLIDEKLNGLKWITPHHDGTPENEISQLNEVIEILKLDKDSKMVLTHHQFFSLVLNENLNIVNRWYTNDGNSYPLKNSKYSKFYEKHLNDHLKENKIKNIYLIGDQNFDDFFSMFFNSNCYEKKLINKISKVYKPKSC